MHRSLARFVCPLVLLACSSPSADDTASSTDEALAVKHLDHVTTISYAPNSFVIGNAYPGWTDEVQGDAQFSSGPGNPEGAAYRWGFLFGENFDRCAWVSEEDLGAGVLEGGRRCSNPQEIDTPYFDATFTDGIKNDLVGDGSDTHMHYAGNGCSDTRGYGNVAPWRVPATPANSVGDVAEGKLLKWRYVSRDGLWVLVRDPAPLPGEPNWYFVHRGCVSLANTN